MIAQLSGEYLRFRPRRALPRLLSYGLFEGRPLLTRGRWVNPLVNASLSLWRALPVLRTVKRPVFIVGTGRSGTSVLGTLLSLHREIGFLNEPKALWHAIHPGEDLIGSYSDGPARYRLDANDANDAARDAARRIYGAYSFLARCTKVVDKYPEAIFRTAFIRALFPDSRFIVLVRDGRDASRSIRAWNDRHARGQGSARVDWWGAGGRKWQALVDQIASTDADLAPQVDALRDLRSDEDRGAVEWLLSMRESRVVIERLAGDVLEVRYERLTGAAFDEMGTILDFCEVADDPDLRRHAASVLIPAGVPSPLVLHPVVAAPFAATMLALDYG